MAEALVTEEFVRPLQSSRIKQHCFSAPVSPATQVVIPSQGPIAVTPSSSPVSPATRVVFPSQGPVAVATLCPRPLPAKAPLIRSSSGALRESSAAEIKSSEAPSSQRDGVVSRMDVQLQLLEEKVMLQQQKIEAVASVGADKSPAAVTDLVELRSFVLQQEKQELQAERLQTIVLDMEQLLLLQKEEQAKANQLADNMREELLEIRAEMHELKSSQSGEKGPSNAVDHAKVDRRCNAMQELLQSQQKEVDALKQEMTSTVLGLSERQSQQESVLEKLKGHVETLGHPSDTPTEHPTGPADWTRQRTSTADGKELQNSPAEESLLDGNLIKQLQDRFQGLQQLVADVDARLNTEVSQLCSKLDKCQKTQEVLKTSAVPDAPGGSQIASMDEELDSLRSAVLKQQELHSEVVGSLWTDAGRLRESLEGQQGQFLALQTQLDHVVGRLMKDPTNRALLSVGVSSTEMTQTPQIAAVLREQLSANADDSTPEAVEPVASPFLEGVRCTKDLKHTPEITKVSPEVPLPERPFLLRRDPNCSKGKPETENS